MWLGLTTRRVVSATRRREMALPAKPIGRERGRSMVHTDVQRRLRKYRLLIEVILYDSMGSLNKMVGLCLYVYQTTRMYYVGFVLFLLLR